MDLFVARQPIFDQRLNVVAYEMLFRSGRSNVYDAADENAATSKVINALFGSPEGEGLRAGKPAYINFPRALLLDGAGLLLPREQVVIEVLENVEPDEAAVAAVRVLKENGYRVALDDYIPNGQPHPLVPLVDVVKVDFRDSTTEQQASMARLHPAGLLAEKVETRAEFDGAAKMGYQLFQGYFFARPEISSSRQIQGLKLNYLRILEEINHAEMDMNKLAALLKREHSLTYKLLHFVNSALFPRHTRLDSVRGALAYIGEVAARKWLSVVALADLASDKPAELATSTLLRARFCELLAREARMGERADDCFLMGLFSRLDAMLGRPLEELLSGISLNPEIVRVLLGTSREGDRLEPVWALVQAYESAGWEELAPAVEELRLTPEALAAAYSAAVVWADQAASPSSNASAVTGA